MHRARIDARVRKVLLVNDGRIEVRVVARRKANDSDTRRKMEWGEANACLNASLCKVANALHVPSQGEQEALAS